VLATVGRYATSPPQRCRYIGSSDGARAVEGARARPHRMRVPQVPREIATPRRARAPWGMPADFAFLHEQVSDRAGVPDDVMDRGARASICLSRYLQVL